VKNLHGTVGEQKKGVLGSKVVEGATVLQRKERKVFPQPGKKNSFPDKGVPQEKRQGLNGSRVRGRLKASG